MKNVVYLLGFALLSAPALADEIVIKGGGTLVGLIRGEDKDGVTIELHTGVITVPRDLIEEIRKGGACPLVEYYRRTAQLEKSRDAAAILELALWATHQGLSRVARQQFERVIELDPNNETAREGLGFKRHNGKWLAPDEFRRAMGYVRFRGRWMHKEDMALILQREKDERERRERERARRRAADLAREAWEASLYARFSSWGRPSSQETYNTYYGPYVPSWDWYYYYALNRGAPDLTDYYNYYYYYYNYNYPPPVTPPPPWVHPGRGVGPGGTPPGHGGEIPGGGGGPGGTPPGQSGQNPGQGVGPQGTPPGHGGPNPGRGR